jgi:hypothetical protein
MSITLEALSVAVIACSFLGIGKLILKYLKIENSCCALDGLLGAGLYAFLISITGHFFSLFELSWVIVITGLVAFTYFVYKKFFHLNFHLPWQVVIYLVFALLIAFYPSTYFDPLNYHLYGIVEWSKIDRLVHIKSAPQLMHNSYADYLYFPFSFWWGQKTINHLLSLQVASQVFTVIFGIFFFSSLMFELIKDKFEKSWLPLLIISVLARASLQHKGMIAKSDWIALCWFIASIYVLIKYQKDRPKLIYLVLFFLSLSVGSKFSYILPAGLLLAGIFYFKKGRMKEYFFVLIIFLLFLAPYLMRNYIWTNNPFFPMARHFFPSSNLGPSWLEGLGHFDVGIYHLDWKFLSGKVVRFFTYEPIVYLSLVLPFFFSSLPRVIKLIWILVYTFLIVFILFFGPSSEIRHFGPIAVLINILGVIGLITWISKYPRLEKFKPYISNFFLIIIICNALRLENQLNPVPSALRTGRWTPRFQSLINEKRGLSLAKYLNENVHNHPRIGLIDDTPPYYLSLNNIVRLWDDPLIDSKLKACSSLECLIRVLKNENIQFLIGTDFLFDPYYNPLILDLILKACAQFPKIIVADLNGEKLISVEALARFMEVKEL